MADSVHHIVAQWVEEVGLPFEIEHSPAPGIAIDIALVEPKIAIEVDGPQHFVRDTRAEVAPWLSGGTRHRNRVLTRLGWDVLSVALWRGSISDTREKFFAELQKRVQLPVPPRSRNSASRIR